MTQSKNNNINNLLYNQDIITTLNIENSRTLKDLSSYKRMIKKKALEYNNNTYIKFYEPPGLKHPSGLYSPPGIWIIPISKIRQYRYY
jgi:hypothetical protein